MVKENTVSGIWETVFFLFTNQEVAYIIKAVFKNDKTEKG